MLALAAWILGLLPAAIIVQHAAFLFLYRARFTARTFAVPPNLQFLGPAIQKARHSEAQEFGLPMLALRYAVPAALIAVLNMAWFYLLCDAVAPIGPYRGAMQLGALGAYVYVLLLLGQRNFQRDITSAVAVWCAATLALGPILAGVVSYLALPPAAAAPDSTFHFASAVVFFLAGLAPRYVASVVEEAARRLLSADGAAGQASRTLPLTRIRGITPDIAARLDEEGIVDVCGLAMANPSRLLRNTNFDARQIVSWMDEALLVYNVPFWEALEADGVTGVIDLAWYSVGADECEPANLPTVPTRPVDPQHRVAVPIPNPTLPPPGTPAPGGAGAPCPAVPMPAKIAALAARIQVDAQRLKDVVVRVCQDAQVQQVWVLYQTDSHELQPADNGDNRQSTLPTEFHR